MLFRVVAAWQAPRQVAVSPRGASPGPAGWTRTPWTPQTRPSRSSSARSAATLSITPSVPWQQNLSLLQLSLAIFSSQTYFLSLPAYVSRHTSPPLYFTFPVCLLLLLATFLQQPLSSPFFILLSFLARLWTFTVCWDTRLQKLCHLHCGLCIHPSFILLPSSCQPARTVSISYLLSQLSFSFVDLKSFSLAFLFSLPSHLSCLVSLSYFVKRLQQEDERLNIRILTHIRPGFKLITNLHFFTPALPLWPPLPLLHRLMPMMSCTLWLTTSLNRLPFLHVLLPASSLTRSSQVCE